jgi:hypothetical protein
VSTQVPESSDARSDAPQFTRSEEAGIQRQHNTSPSSIESVRTKANDRRSGENTGALSIQPGSGVVEPAARSATQWCKEQTAAACGLVDVGHDEAVAIRRPW